jgi:hypothetical protein
MLAEIATTDSFKTIHRAVFVDALPDTDFTANALIEACPRGRTSSIASASRTLRPRPSSASR